MRRHTAGTLVALLCIGAALVAVAPAAAGKSGKQTFKGTIVASGKTGDRVVVSTEIEARGVFKGHGTLVEVDNLPGDSDNVLRDDLVFKGGTMHLVSTNVDVSFSLNPKSCRFEVTAVQTAVVDGGTGKFAAASGTFDSTVHAKGELPRNPDHSCSMDQAPRHEVDEIEATGTLSY